MLMGGVIVGDDVDVEITWGLLIDGFEKGQPLLVAVARRQAGDQLALEIIERSKQGQRAMSHVIVGLVRMWPMPSGKPGCVRSNAWHCDFSSQHNTSAFSGGLRYSPMTSQNFSSKRLSFDSLKVRERCGLMSLAAHSRCTLADDTPAARAIVRQLQRPRCGGGVTACSITCWTAASGSHGLPPRPVRSVNPSNRAT